MKPRTGSASIALAVIFQWSNIHIAKATTNAATRSARMFSPVPGAITCPSPATTGKRDRLVQTVLDRQCTRDPYGHGASYTDGSFLWRLNDD